MPLDVVFIVKCTHITLLCPGIVPDIIDHVERIYPQLQL